MKIQPRELVDAYLAALSDRDYERARTFLADSDFEYTSPIATFADADAFMDYTMLVGGIIHAITCRKAFVDGPDVCHFLVFDTQLAEKVSTPVVQWSQVAGGRIRRIEVLFDAHQYKLMFPRSRTGGGA